MPIERRTSWRTWVGTLVLVAGLVAMALLSGPLFPFNPAPSHVANAVAEASDLERYLREREAQHAGVKPGLAKTILWNDAGTREGVHRTTPLALVYLHGFSASRRDISPVVETLARRLGANAFLTRLAAHGLATPGEFATVTAQDWLNDAREALAIGERIGDRVILIGISTGALLATMAALEGDASRIAALILLSPNFGLADWRGKFVSGPLGPWLARLLIGADHSFRPDSTGHAEFWTTRYPSRAIVAMMDLVNHAQSLHFGNLEIPTLIIYTDNDTVVDTKAIRDRFDAIGAPRKLIIDLPEASRHELTGDALAPETVQPVLVQITRFLSAAGVTGAAPASKGR
jgi:alpha-beta hydrolase superfamily lysophospholipase